MLLGVPLSINIMFGYLALFNFKEFRIDDYSSKQQQINIRGENIKIWKFKGGAVSSEYLTRLKYIEINISIKLTHTHTHQYIYIYIYIYIHNFIGYEHS